MALTPLDIHNKEFRRGFRGYQEDEVDEFLDEVVREFELLIKENNSLKEELESLKVRLDQYQTIETTLQNTLVVAQGAADEVKHNARKEAELIVQEARSEAEKIIQAAYERQKSMAVEMDELRRQMALFRARMRSMLLAQIEILAQEDADETRQEGAGMPQDLPKLA